MIRSAMLHHGHLAPTRTHPFPPTHPRFHDYTLTLHSIMRLHGSIKIGHHVHSECLVKVENFIWTLNKKLTKEKLGKRDYW